MTKHFCDSCEREVPSNEEFTMIDIVVTEGKSSSFGSAPKKFSYCKQCGETIRRMLPEARRR